jgi:polysaccharide biosynthesis/export protein
MMEGPSRLAAHWAAFVMASAIPWDRDAAVDGYEHAMHKIPTVLALVFLTWLAACSDATYHMLPPPGNAGSDQVRRSADAETAAYTLRADDQVAVRFFYNSELDQDVTIGRDGKIALQLVGEIDAAGLYPKELASVISDRYASVLRQPEVNVAVQYAPRLFYIFGEVNRPGGYPHELGMTVVSAIALAGGFTYRAKGNEVRIVRAEDEGGESRKAGQEAAVLPGDVIEVPERHF